MSLAADLKMYGRFALGLRRFLRNTISLDQARATIRTRMQERETSFLRVIEKGIFGNPRSAYLPLSTLIRAIAGTLLPIVVVGGYFVYKDAFVEFVDPAVLFNLHYVERVPTTLIQHFANPIAAVYRSYPLGVLPIVLGFLATAAVHVWRVRENDGSISKLMAS